MIPLLCNRFSTLGACILLSALLLQTGTTTAQPTTGILQGKVTDAFTGEAIGGVNVILMQNGNILTAQSTNASGKYMYDNMKPTTFDVLFSKKAGSSPTMK